MLAPAHKETDATPKAIDSPLSAFNNLIVQLTKRITALYNPACEESFVSKIVFTNDSLIIGEAGVKLTLTNHKIYVSFMTNYELQDLQLVQKTIEVSHVLREIFNNYMYMISTITGNYDNSVSEKFVNDLHYMITRNLISPDKLFLLPYKRKINHLYDETDQTLDKLYNKFSYIIKFKRNTPKTFSYKILRVLSSDFDESKSLENLRFVETEIIKEDTLSINKLNKFLSELFYYGDLID